MAASAGVPTSPVASVALGDLLQRAEVLLQAGAGDGRSPLRRRRSRGGRGPRRGLIRVAPRCERQREQGEQQGLSHPAQNGRAASAHARSAKPDGQRRSSRSVMIRSTSP